MLRLRAGTATLIIGARSSAGSNGHRYNLDSEDDIRRRLNQAFADPSSRDAIRRFWGHWQGDARLAGVKDQSIADRIAKLCVRGPLVAFVVTDTTVHGRGTSAIHPSSMALLRNVMVQAPLPHRRSSGPTDSVWIESAGPASFFQLSASTLNGAAGRQLLRRIAFTRLTLVERLALILFRAAKSERLSAEMRHQLEGMLSDPVFVAWLAGAMTVWFVSHAFIVGEVLDGLLVVAAVILSGAGFWFAFRSIVDAAHLIGHFVELASSAKSEADLDAAADVLAQIIATLGIAILIAAITHAATRATSNGMQAKTSSLRKAPEPRSKPVERLSERRSEPNVETKPLVESGELKTKKQLDEMYESAPAAKVEIDALADKIAEQNGGHVSKVELKSKERALEKANNDYGGNASRVTDIARNTIVVPAEKIPSVVAALKEQGAKVREVNPDMDEFGYSGANAKIQTSAGIQGEIQVNSPEMIFAKEKPEIARKILGDEQYDAIASKMDVPGGKGHEFYEQARSLPLNSPERAALAEESKAYYDKFR